MTPFSSALQSLLRHTFLDAWIGTRIQEHFDDMNLSLRTGYQKRISLLPIDICSSFKELIYDSFVSISNCTGEGTGEIFCGIFEIRTLLDQESCNIRVSGLNCVSEGRSRPTSSTTRVCTKREKLLY
jgi:hypothetical protein